jgi:hypothetical protein
VNVEGGMLVSVGRDVSVGGTVADAGGEVSVREIAAGAGEEQEVMRSRHAQSNIEVSNKEGGMRVAMVLRMEVF